MRVLWHGAAPTVINLRQTAKFLGSLKLAVPLLSILTAVLIWATFYESRTSTAAVTALVYRSWWFNVLLGALGLNLSMAAALRWPWKHHQTGFVVTHAGLILILGGCSASFHFGTEGLMGLRVGERPSNTVQLEDRALTVMSPQTTRTRLRVDRRGNVHPNAVTLPSGLRLTLDEFYPNARNETIVREGGSERNPAVWLWLGSPSVQHNVRQWLMANDPQANRMMLGPALLEFYAAKDQAEAKELTATSSVQGLAFRVVALPDNSLRYVSSSRTNVKSGALTIGEPIAPGWMDFQVTVAGCLTNAVAKEQIVRLPDDPEQNQNALRMTVHGSGEPRSAWLLFGHPIQLGSLQLMFAWNMMPLPFTVALEDFVIERDEGSHNVAGWTSKVRFTDSATGAEKRADVWMNHPAVFKGYKFSQASWNPQDLKYTVLQVKKDPLWVIVLTWGGSGLTILGIALMFYARRWA